jgi:hypothetical protein
MPDKTNALIEAGFIRGLDIVLLITQVILTIILVTVSVTEQVSVNWRFAIFGVMLFLMLVWSISVSFRAAYFALTTRAIAETMPQQAAAYAAGILKQNIPGKA